MRRPAAAAMLVAMEHCIVFTVRDGKTQAARDFMRELADTRGVEQQRSQRRVGIGGERWFLANSRHGELLVGLIESGDLARTVGLFAVSLHPYDLWFKRCFRDVTVVDLNDAPHLDAAVLLASSHDGQAEPMRRVLSAAN
jgi:hypothetical protein